MSLSKLHRGEAIKLLASLPSNSVDCALTDPPYGIDFQSCSSPKQRRKPKIANDKRPYIWFLPELFRVLKPGAPLLCFTRYDVEHDFRWAMELAGFDVHGQVIWDKVGHGMGDLAGDFAPQHENIIFASKGRFRFPGRRPKSVLRYPRVPPQHLVHPNQKPVDLLVDLIESVTVPGATVIDPFMGSASSIVAAVQSGRRGIGIEVDEGYLDLAEKRMQEASAQHHTTAGDAASPQRTQEGLQAACIRDRT